VLQPDAEVDGETDDVGELLTEEEDDGLLLGEGVVATLRDGLFDLLCVPDGE
jgi:hypothetical protein